MEFWKTSKILILPFLLLIIAAPFTMAQEVTAQGMEVSDAELQNFVDISNALLEKQQEIQEKMNSVFEGNELNQEQYTSIAKSFQDKPDAKNSISKAELEAFESIKSQLQVLQKESQKTVVETIQQSKLGMERYQAISMALQKDKELNERYLSVLKSSTSE